MIGCNGSSYSEIGAPIAMGVKISGPGLKIATGQVRKAIKV